MISANPQQFTIEATKATNVRFRFRVGGDVIELGSGVVTINIDVEDSAGSTGGVAGAGGQGTGGSSAAGDTGHAGASGAACIDTDDVVELDNGGTFTCARKRSGKVLCWGANGSGQLGNGTTASSLLPVEVLGITDAVEVTTGGMHACVRRPSGQVLCWGSNEYGGLGDGTTLTRTIPVAVVGLDDAIQVSAGPGNSSCAVRRSGRVVCWGYNTDGELGDGTTTNSSIPVDVHGIEGAVQVSVGYPHACSRLASGQVECWGNNANGCLGNGTTEASCFDPQSSAAN